MSDWLNDLDKKYEQAEAADAGSGNFDPIPEGKTVLVIAKEQKSDQVGEKGTPVCKVTFEVESPEEYAGKRIWHDFWLTENNFPYLKRDLGEKMGWTGKPSQLMEASDASVIGLKALATVGVESYVDKNGNDRKKNIVKFFDAPQSENIPF